MWTVEHTADGVATIRVEAKRKKKWEQYVLVSSDRHVDNPLSRQGLQKHHLEIAKERDAPVIDFGDLFCAMQGKKDRRADKEHIRAENQKNDYYDSLVDTVEDFFLPYADQLALIGKGNHEAAITKHAETDLTKRLVRRLRSKKSPVVLGGFRGWVRFLFKASTLRQGFDLFYSHGAGGSAPVTKGVIGTNRRASYIDADIICTGHIHESWSLELCRVGLSPQGDEVIKDQLHLCIPTYKEEFKKQHSGFHIEREAAPKPIGAWWLRFYWDSFDKKFKVDSVRAK